MLSFKKNLTEAASNVASATTSAAANAQSAMGNVSAPDLDGLRSSLSNMSAVEQMKEIKSKQADKFNATSSQLMSYLAPTEELVSAFPNPLNGKGDESDKNLKFRYVKYIPPPEAQASVDAAPAKTPATSESNENVPTEIPAQVDTAAVTANAIPTTMQDKVMSATGVDVKAMAAEGIKEAEDALVLRTNGVGYSSGFCISKELVKANIICTLDDHNVPMVQIQLDHHKIPKIASIIDVPLGSQEIPVPFLALPTTALGLFGFIMTVNVQLLYEGEEDVANEGLTITDAKASAREGAGKMMSGMKSLNPFKKEKILPAEPPVEPSEAATTTNNPATRPASISTSTDKNIAEFKKIKVSMGLSFRIEDITGILSVSIPEMPLWVVDNTIDAEELKKAKEAAASAKAKAAANMPTGGKK
mmetsp:Transcript_21893/g.45605  ORF Transcript_21893/g.45605 Transcript_21893/m.45605 type:complete len:417 (+) Transcript_21893:115-1365(+)